ncbi:DUF2442 domain-containing protein [Pleurocapsales cyanobacterium LEGE 06147]|nr:DUF2442 domain-containing protein [Pleurocapsales cyanobacterium LEGE 06147]
MTQLTDRQIETQIDRAIAYQAEIDATEPRTTKVLFDEAESRITIHFNNGTIFSFLTDSVEAIAYLSTKTSATVELTPSGKGLRWDEPDIDLSIIGLMIKKVTTN